MTVSQILKAKGRDVVTAGANTRVADIARTLSEKRIGAVVITGAGGRIEGIVSERDVVRDIGKMGAAALEQTVSSIMTRNVRTARESDSEAELMALMTENRIRHLPVVTDGKLAGMISIGEDMKAYIASAG
jgi:CBS domain-containing protein